MLLLTSVCLELAATANACHSSTQVPSSKGRSWAETPIVLCFPNTPKHHLLRAICCLSNFCATASVLTRPSGCKFTLEIVLTNWNPSLPASLGRDDTPQVQSIFCQRARLNLNRYLVTLLLPTPSWSRSPEVLPRLPVRVRKASCPQCDPATWAPVEDFFPRLDQGTGGGKRNIPCS